MKFFVMLAHPQGYPMPITVSEDDESTMLFESEAHAETTMRNHSAAQAWGYDVYPWPPEVES